MADLGRLLRVQAMVTDAAQIEAVRDSAAALVHAYMNLRSELLDVLASDQNLQDELERLFKPLDEPPPFNLRFAAESQLKLAATAEEAQMQLRMLSGWIRGLIEALTFQERLRLEAEAKVRLENKPATGFGLGAE